MTAWTTPDLIAEHLGPSVVLDPIYAQSCAESADLWAKRQRREAGYNDPDTAPSADVIFGTTMYGVALYRERGGADGYPSYEDTSSMPSTGAQRRIKQLLGVPRAAADTAAVAEVVPLAVRRHPSLGGRAWR